MQDYSKEVKLQEVIKKLQKKGYKIETRSTGASRISEITVNKKVIMLDQEETGEIEVTITREETPGTKYYAKLNNGYYEIALVKGEIQIRKKEARNRKNRSNRNRENRIRTDRRLCRSKFY